MRAPSQVQLRFPFCLGQFESTLFVVIEYGSHNLLRLVDDPDEIHILRIDHALGDHPIANPVEQSAPEGRIHENHRNATDFSGLHQGQHLAQFIERSETSGQHDIGTGKFDKHHLARKKMAERLAHILIGVFFLLVRQLETGSQLKLYMIDISKEELAADVHSAADLRDTGLYRLLVEQTVQTPGAEPWAVIVGNYRFGPDGQDVEVLSRMARIAHRAGAPFLAEASPRVLGCTSLASTPHPRDWKVPDERARAWHELRHQPEANAVGLALPRFLLRLPYGKKTSPTESFDLEEFPESPAHEDYCWGNPAFAVALLLAQSFSDSGWEMHAGSVAEIERLPLHVYGKGGEYESKPCTEVLLTEEAAERIVDAGLIPLISFKGRDAARVARFQSFAEPLCSLAGRWGR